MNTIRTLAVLSVAALATACANPGATRAGLPYPGMTPMKMGMGMGEDASAAAMDPRMKSMHEMHQKMARAVTPAERQALMADHLKAMQGGMAMMKEMHAMHSKSGMGGMGMTGSSGGAAAMGGMDHGSGRPGDMAKTQPMMADHMAMMTMMLDMMADRMSPAASGQ